MPVIALAIADTAMLTPSVERPHMGPIAIPAPARTSVAAPHTTPKIVEAVPRSEERRVGKECRVVCM